MAQPCAPEHATCDVTLGDLIANAKGGKAAAITPAIRLIIQNATTPFQVSSFDGNSARKSFELRSTPALRDFCVKLDAKLQPFGKKLGCNSYNSLLKEQKADYEPLLRTKLTIDNETGKSPTKFFEAGTKRRMSDAEVRDLDFRECKFNVLLRISSVYVNGGTFGPVASPEAIVVKREDLFPEALDDDCDQLAGLQMG